MARPLPPKGVYAAVSSAIDAHYSPDHGRITDHCRWLLANGCDGLAPLGTTGEANSFPLAQRLALLEAMAADGLPMDRVIAGTGSCALADAIALSKSALDAGVAGLLVLPPFYYKSPSEEGLFAWFSGLAEALGARAPNIHLYHIPQMSAVPITLSLTTRLRAAFPGVFVGLKDSSGDFDNTLAFLAAFEGFNAYSGSEALLHDNLKAGGVGCISASTNITCPVAAKVFAAATEADAARWQETTTALRMILQSKPTLCAIKAILATWRNDPAWRAMVPPNMDLSQADTDELIGALGEVYDLRGSVEAGVAAQYGDVPAGRDTAEPIVGMIIAGNQHQIGGDTIEKIEIRESLPNDITTIEKLYPEAFPDEDLFPLVRELQSDGSNALSLVATADNALVGHVVFTPCSIAGNTNMVALLGPLAVAPAWQRQGIGKAIVREGLQRLENAGTYHVYVLGDPAYYRRFGFEPEDRVRPPYALPEAWRGAWQLLCLGGSKPPLRGKLSVPRPWRQRALWAP